MVKTKSFRLDLPIDRPVSRESVYKALVDAIIRLTGEKLSYVCVKVSAGGGSLTIHLADEKFEDLKAVGTTKRRGA